jgi:hypothetical protein
VENILVRDFVRNYYQIDDDIYVSDWWEIIWGAFGDNTHIRLVEICNTESLIAPVAGAYIVLKYLLQFLLCSILI